MVAVGEARVWWRAPIEVAATYGRCRAEAQSAAFGNGDLYVEEFIRRRAMWKCRFSATSTARSLTSVSANAAFSGTSRRSSRWRRRRVSRRISVRARRSLMPPCALRAALAYSNAGTFEFLVDVSGP